LVLESGDLVENELSKNCEAVNCSISKAEDKEYDGIIGCSILKLKGY
jgi:hypothetical protein